jgi:hypothetical protein
MSEAMEDVSVQVCTESEITKRQDLTQKNRFWTIHLLGGRFRETDASKDTIAYIFQKTWLDGDSVEADGTQSLCASGRERPGFIPVATYLQKVIPHRQSYIRRLVKGAPAEVRMVRLEPTLWSIGRGHRSRMLAQ